MQHLAPLALVLVLAGCVVPRTADEGALAVADRGRPAAFFLPPVRAALKVPGGELVLAELVDAFARENGIQIQRQEEARLALERTPVTLAGPLVVPPGEVYPFLESLLASNGFVLTASHAGSVPLLTIWSTYRLQRGSLEWLPVAPDESDVLFDHPALLVETLVELPHLDVRQLTNAMRGTLSDTNTQALLAAGEHHVLLRGRGREVARMVARFRELDAQTAAVRATAEPLPAAAEAAAGERRGHPQ